MYQSGQWRVGMCEQIAVVPPYAHIHIHVTGNKNRHTFVKIKFGLVLNDVS
jgi:hypothetical protein